MAEEIRIITFPSVWHAFRAEKILKAAELSCTLIPVPRELSSSCQGLAAKVDESHLNRVLELLDAQQVLTEMRALLFGLRPGLLVEDGLVVALERMRNVVGAHPRDREIRVEEHWSFTDLNQRLDLHVLHADQERVQVRVRSSMIARLAYEPFEQRLFRGDL